jgi:hypothetical protein
MSSVDLDRDVGVSEPREGVDADVVPAVGQVIEMLV